MRNTELMLSTMLSMACQSGWAFEDGAPCAWDFEDGACNLGQRLIDQANAKADAYDALDPKGCSRNFKMERFHAEFWTTNRSRLFVSDSNAKLTIRSSVGIMELSMYLPDGTVALKATSPIWEDCDNYLLAGAIAKACRHPFESLLPLLIGPENTIELTEEFASVRSDAGTLMRILGAAPEATYWPPTLAEIARIRAICPTPARWVDEDSPEVESVAEAVGA
jgi:hypothetical protein